MKNLIYDYPDGGIVFAEYAPGVLKSTVMVTDGEFGARKVVPFHEEVFDFDWNIDEYKAESMFSVLTIQRITHIWRWNRMKNNQTVLTWHTTKELPEYGEDVLVHFLETDSYIVTEIVYDDDYGSPIWWTIDRNYEIDTTDRWAYLEPIE